MKIPPFKLERYFAKYEFSTQYQLSSSDCDGLPLQQVLSYADSETKHLWDNLQLGYTESLGLPQLREEISKLYKSVTKDEVLVITPEEGIFIALQTILEKGDHVVCTFPGYQSLYSIAESLDCEVSKWMPSEKDGWYFDPADLEKLIKPNTKLIIVNFPHNPTGYLASKKDFEKIISIAKEKNIFLFSDEMYKFLEYDSADRLPSATDVYENAISLFGMSKTYGLAGVRIGWLTTKNKDLYSQFSTYKDFTTICSSAPSEVLSLIALKAGDKIIKENLNKINKNLSIVEDFMKRNSKIFSWVKPKAGTICFPKLNIDMSSYDFCEKVIKDTGIMILPSTVYDFDDKHIRIGYGRKNMPDALKLFESYLQKEFK